jgi:hypothetical protein
VSGAPARRTTFVAVSPELFPASVVLPSRGTCQRLPVELTFDAFCDIFLQRHGATVAERTRRTLEERFRPAREHFGTWTLRELEGAAEDIADWRATFAETSRYRLTSALRQALAAAVRWRYIAANPAVEAGRNPQPRFEELRPFTREQVDAIAEELGPVYGPLVIATETACGRTSGSRSSAGTSTERAAQSSCNDGSQTAA